MILCAVFAGILRSALEAGGLKVIGFMITNVVESYTVVNDYIPCALA